MGKAKKVTEKLIQYYRGVPCRPSQTADEDEVKTIVEALKSDRSNKNSIYNTLWLGQPVTLKIVYGLSASLRCLKQKRTKALIYDDTAGPHLTKYFDEFSTRAGCSVIRVHRLIDKAPELKLTTLLIVSVVESTPSSGVTHPNSEAFDKFCQLLQTLIDKTKKPVNRYQTPVVERVRPSGSSKSKKLKRSKLDLTRSVETESH